MELDFVKMFEAFRLTLIASDFEERYISLVWMVYMSLYILNEDFNYAWIWKGKLGQSLS